MQNKNTPKGNAFVNIVRGVVREEMRGFEKRQEVKFNQLEQKLINKIDEKINEKFEESFAKYRNETLTKLDAAIARLDKRHEEQIAHDGQHEEIGERLEDLESIHPQGRHVS
ncbi:hypothetical protein A2699_06275 [Candidatus Gottesmanbacteria bacterium RIFCSPHIGHO2_01_FULL_43_15]|nr:MAG: hypothetical protein A2699_06275 [Candidatus Gottesmanbacteria bacterium RIFCSPHIGHO2_01_FULL_43_15]